MYFYLGIPEPAWLEHMVVPTFVSRMRLLRKVDRLPRARAPWAMDSGGFTQVTAHGGWCISPKEYLREIDFFRREIGNLDWASPMDWMCEAAALKKTGKSLREHQRLTLENFIELRMIGSYTNIIPVLQGQSVDDYLRHAEQYERAGFDMRKEKRVGIGSVCRRQKCGEAFDVIEAVAALGYRVHAFGLSTHGLRTSSELIVSADSMAWSFKARSARILLPGHHHSKTRDDCRNCPVYALTWRQQMLAGLSDAVDHPRLVQATADDVAWLARQAGTPRTPRPRGAPPPIDIEKLLNAAQEVVSVNQTLDEEEAVEDERGSLLGDHPIPTTYRLALPDEMKQLLTQWRSYIVKARGAQWGELIDTALAAEDGGVWPPTLERHPERCQPIAKAAKVLAKRRWRQVPANIDSCEPGDAGFAMSKSRRR